MSLFPSPFTIQRTSKTMGADGLWVLGTPSQLVFHGSIQPLTGYELSLIDTGSQGMGKVWIRTTAILERRKPDSTDAGDILLWNSDRWEVIDDRPYLNGIIPHHKYLAEWRPAVSA